MYIFPWLSILIVIGLEGFSSSTASNLDTVISENSGEIDILLEKVNKGDGLDNEDENKLKSLRNNILVALKGESDPSDKNEELKKAIEHSANNHAPEALRHLIRAAASSKATGDKEKLIELVKRFKTAARLKDEDLIEEKSENENVNVNQLGKEIRDDIILEDFESVHNKALKSSDLSLIIANLKDVIARMKNSSHAGDPRIELSEALIGYANKEKNSVVRFSEATNKICDNNLDDSRCTDAKSALEKMMGSDEYKENKFDAPVVDKEKEVKKTEEVKEEDKNEAKEEDKNKVKEEDKNKVKEEDKNKVKEEDKKVEEVKVKEETKGDQKHSEAVLPSLKHIYKAEQNEKIKGIHKKAALGNEIDDNDRATIIKVYGAAIKEYFKNAKGSITTLPVDILNALALYNEAHKHTSGIVFVCLAESSLCSEQMRMLYRTYGLAGGLKMFESPLVSKTAVEELQNKYSSICDQIQKEDTELLRAAYYANHPSGQAIGEEDTTSPSIGSSSRTTVSASAAAKKTNINILAEKLQALIAKGIPIALDTLTETELEQICNESEGLCLLFIQSVQPESIYAKSDLLKKTICKGTRYPEALGKLPNGKLHNSWSAVCDTGINLWITLLVVAAVVVVLSIVLILYFFTAIFRRQAN